MELPLEVQQLCEQGLKMVRDNNRHYLEPEFRATIYKSFGISTFAREPLDQTQQIKSTYGDPWPDLEVEERQTLQQEISWIDIPVNLTQADKVFGWLAVLTARKVFSIWKQIPDNEYTKATDWPDAIQIVEIAKGFLQGKISTAKAKTDLCGKFYDDQTNLETITTKNAYCAFFSSYAALEAILVGRENFRWDFAELSMIAYSVTDENEVGVWDSNHIEGITGYTNDELDEIVEDKGPRPSALTWQGYLRGYIWVDEIRPLKHDLQKRLEFWEWWLMEAIPEAWELAYRKSDFEEWEEQVREDEPDLFG